MLKHGYAEVNGVRLHYVNRANSKLDGQEADKLI